MTQQRAVLAGGCFWGMQDLIRKLPGVEATRVGYTGGDVLKRDVSPSRRPCGGRSRSCSIPDRISFRRLLEFFFPDPRSDHAGPPGQ